MLFKVIIIGDSGVGKTSILQKFIHNEYKNQHLTTIGIDLFVKYINVNGKQVKMQIWDTAGQEKFRSLISNIYKGSHCILLCYDVTNRTSFDNLKKWYDNINNEFNYSPNKLPLIIIIGNKSDVTHKRVVSSKEALSFASDHLIKKYIETSALSGKNIEELFKYLSGELVKIVIQTQENDNLLDLKMKEMIKLKNEKFQKRKKSKCCTI